MMRTTIAILLLAGSALAQGPYPIPALERFPDRPYVPPPTPEEVARQESEMASNEVAEVQLRVAMTNVLKRLGVELPADSDWRAKTNAAAALRIHGNALKKVDDDAKIPIQASSNAVKVYYEASGAVKGQP